MTTIVRKIPLADIDCSDSRNILAEAAAVLARGGLVAFPTETVYGLGADALNVTAVAGIFAAKQRPDWDPLIVHIASWAMLHRVATQVSPPALSLMRALWPGPLTLLLPRSAAVPDCVTAGRPLVAVRWPAHPVAQSLILAANAPIAAPSANLFGHVSPTTAQHVLADLDGRIDFVLDGGATTLGLESAVLDPNTVPPTLYRPGTLRIAQIEAIVGPVQRYVTPSAQNEAEPQSRPSPGVDVRHYAPRARVVLVHSQDELVAATAVEQGRVGVMLPAGWTAPDAANTFAWGDWQDAAALSHNVYAGLRWLDDQQVDVILVPLPAETAETIALRDRVMKAARGR